MKKTIFLVLVILISLSGCEKDDICAATTITTPRLVISFYDIGNPSVLKSVTNLTIIGDGLTTGVPFKGNTLINGSTVSIPLKTDVDRTSFRFILNFGNTNPAIVNEDKLSFKYTRENSYVSRACGYKTVFALDPIAPFILTDGAVADRKWIQFIAVKNSSINNENETHLEIYF